MPLRLRVPAASHQQVPRLSSMLRAALGSAAPAAGRGNGKDAAPLQLPDLQQLLAQRSRLLEGRRRERADMQVSSARAELVAAVLGSWAGAPKAARDEFEKYMRGEQGAQKLCAECWVRTAAGDGWASDRFAVMLRSPVWASMV